METFTITAYPAGPLIVNGPAMWSPFDSILAYLAVERAKALGDGELQEQDIAAIIDDLPLKKVPAGNGYVTAASMVFIEGEHNLDTVTIYKAIRPQRFIEGGIDSNLVVDAVKKRFIAATAGSYKTGAPGLYPRLASTLSWTMTGDKAKVLDLLREWTHVGKKSALGYGKLKSYSVRDASPDEPILRPLPVDYFKVEPISFMRLKPAYWQPQDRMLSGIGDINTSAR